MAILYKAVLDMPDFSLSPELLGTGSATHYPQKIAGVTSRRLFPRRPEKSQSPGKLQGPPPLPRSRTKRPLTIPVRERKILQTKSECMYGDDMGCVKFLLGGEIF